MIEKLRIKLAELYYRPRLSHLGVDAQIHPGAHLEGFLKNISLGDGVRVGRGAMIDCDVATVSVTVGEHTSISPSAMILSQRGNIQIGHHCSVNPFCVLYGLGGLKIGNYVRIATHTVIAPANHIFDDPHTPITKQGLRHQGVVIEDDVWLGAGVRVLDGCTIGTGSVIGAGSVVTKSVEPFSVVAGVPGRVIGKRGETTVPTHV